MKKVVWLSSEQELFTKYYNYVTEIFPSDIYISRNREDISNEVNLIIIDKFQVGEFGDFDRNKIIVLVDDFMDKSNRKMIIQGYKTFYKNLPVLSLVEQTVGRSNLLDYNEHKEKIEVESQSKILAFHSPKGGVGTTTIAFNSAISLSQSNKVIFIDLTKGDQLCTFVNRYDTSQGLEPVISYINEGNHTTDKINTLVKRNISKHGKLDYLFGLSKSHIEYISQEIINLVFTSLKKLDYDYIVIDTNNSTSIMNLSILSISKTNYLIIDSTLQSSWSLMKLYPIISKLNMLQKSFIIMNKVKLNSIVSIKDLENQSGLKCVGRIKNIKYIDESSILYDKSNRFRKSIKRIMGV